MARLARAALVLASVVVLALVALALALPRLVDLPRLRHFAEETAFAALGRKIGYERPSIGLLPPALVLEGPWIAGAQEDGERLLEAESLALELELWPLLEGRFVPRSIEIEGPVLRLARGAGGLELPLPSGGVAPEGGSFRVPRVKVVRGTLVLRDAVVSPLVTSELQDLALELDVEAPGAPLGVKGSFGLAGGRVDVAGSAGADGALDLELGLDAVPLGAHAAYLALSSAALAATLDGELRLQRRAGEPLGVAGRVSLHDGRVRLGALEIGSGAQARIALEGIPDATRGRIEIDAQSAQVAWPGVFSKPAGLPAALSGELRRGESGGLAFEGATLQIGELRAQGRASRGAGRTRVELRSDRLDARALAAILPGVARIPGIGGALALRSARLETEPLVAVADVELLDLTLAPGTPEALRVRGPIDQRGQTARASGLAVEIGGQPMTVDGEVLLGDAPTYAIRARLRGADARAFLQAILPKPPRLEGRLDLDADLHGPLDSRSPVDTAEGRLRIHVAEGRIAGVSLLGSAVSALSALGQLSGLSLVLGTGGPATPGPDGGGDRFRTFDATVQQAQGVSRTDDLRIVYPTYDVTLSGELRLSEGSVKMQGDILVGAELVGPIGKGLGLVGLGCAMPNRIPVPEISGPVSDLRVRPDAAYVLGFVTRCNPLAPLEAVGKGILEVPRALGGVLGHDPSGKEGAEEAPPQEP